MNWIFTTPWMLAGLAAVGLPILIHYLTRARPRRVPFPPYKFLVEACAGQQAVHRLRTFILLALRCLAVLAVVLLFARPFLRQGGAAAGADTTRRVVLILDASLSMRAVEGGVPIFARAQGEAAEVLRSLDSGSEAALILAGATPRPLLPALSRNLPALHQLLVQAQPTHEFGDPAAALALAKRLLGEHTGTVYIFSDFQESNWNVPGVLPPGLAYKLRPTVTGPVENAAITAIRLSPAEPVVGESFEAVCTVFNYTSRPRQETVRLELGDISQERPVSLPPFGSAAALFNVTFTQPGLFIGKASLPPDNLPEDNTRHLVVRVHKALQILLVSDTSPADRRSAAFFLSRALVPSPEAAPGLSLIRRHSQDVDRGILETADAFVLAAPAQLTGETIEVIGRRLTEGAQLLVFLDGPQSHSLAPATFTPPFQLLGAVTSPAGNHVRPGARSFFSDYDAADWLSVRFHRHLQNRILDGREDDVLLFHADGAAALTLTRTGKGAVVFANLALTPDGGDLVGSPMFPALLHELLRALRRGDDAQFVTPGSPWTLNASAAGEAPVTVHDPEGNAIETQVIVSGRVQRLALPAAGAPGAYLARQSEAIIGAGVVNVDPRESDTRPMALEKLNEGSDVRVSVLRDEQELSMTSETRPLWPLLAGAAALFLGLEMLLLGFWRQTRTPSIA